MKKYLLLLILFGLFTSCSSSNKALVNYAKTLPYSLDQNEEGEFEVLAIIDFDNISKDQLYIRSRSWVVDAYVSAKNVIQMEDKDEGLIILKGADNVAIKSMGINVGLLQEHTLRIDVKENKVRLIISDFHWDSDQMGTIYGDQLWASCKNTICEQQKAGATQTANDMISSFKKHIKAGKSDW